MMVSERPSAPPPSPPDLPPAEIPAILPPTTITPTAPVKLEPSPFLSGFDLLLVVGTIIFGFAIASFAVRNADFWQHLGAGKLIAEGKYEFGKDPFSYSTEGRQWTNPSWLFDLIVYKIHGVAKGDGQQFGRAVVIFKGALIALLAAVLLFARRPGQSMWIGVLCVGLALLASAPRLVMDPVVMSMFFLGVTVWLLIRADQFENPWSLPAAIAAVFALWSNSDAWFVLGPLTLGFFLLGEFLHQRMQPAEAGEKRLPLRPLTIALIVGVLACMLNPHHVGVWRLPDELQTSVGATVSRDAAFAPIFRSSFEKGGLDLDSAQGGNPINGVAFIALVLLNVLALFLARNRLSWGLLLVNSGMLALALVRQRAIPFYAIVAAPITALYFGNAVEGLRQRTFTRGTMQGLAAGRVATRMFLFVAGLAALAATWPGWLHPLGQQRRLSWDVVPDPSFEKAARLLQQWRTEGRVPSEARSLILSPDLAAYCAYYAPSEKSYFDGRVGLHAPEADSFFKVRQNLNARRSTDPRPPEFDGDKFLIDQKISYVVMTGRDREEGLNSFVKFVQDTHRDVNPAVAKWQLWDIAGRSAIFGRTRQTVISQESMRSLQFNPLARAFGPDVIPQPDTAIPLPPAQGQQSFVDKIVKRFLDVAPEPAAGADEAMLINKYQQTMYERLGFRMIGRYLALVSVCGTVTHPIMQQVSSLVEMTPDFNAVAILAVRAARQGIASSPNHPDGYMALADSYNSDAWYGLPEEAKELVVISSLGRYYARLTPEQQASPTDALAQQAARKLFLKNDQNERIDLAAEYLRRWLMGLRAGPRPLRTSETEFLRNFTQVGSDPRLQMTDAETDEALKRLEQLTGRLEQAVRERENLWINNTARTQSQVQRAMAAIRFGLFRKSLQEFNAIETGDGSKLLMPEIYGVLFQRIQLNLLVGQPEEAEKIIRMIEDRLEKQQRDQQRTDFDDELSNMKTIYHKHVLDTMLVLGRFNEVAKVLSSEGSQINAVLAAMKTQPLIPFPIKKEAVALGMPQIVAFWIAQHLSNRPGATFAGIFNPLEPVLLEQILEQQIGAYAARFRTLEELHFRLAMTYLEQGNNKSAAAQFREVLRSATPTFQTPTQRTAKMYLDLLKGK